MKKDYNTIKDVQEHHDETTPLRESSSSDLPIRKRSVVLVYAAVCVAFLLALGTSFKAGEASATSTSETRSPWKSSVRASGGGNVTSVEGSREKRARCNPDKCSHAKCRGGWICKDDLDKCHKTKPQCDNKCYCPRKKTPPDFELIEEDGE